MNLYLNGLVRILSVGFLLVASGCYPGSAVDSFEDTDTVVTLKNPDANFSVNRTFSLPDTVVDLCDFTSGTAPSKGEVTAPPDCSEEDEINHSFDSLILQTVRDNLIALGYTEESDPAANPPDVGIFVAGARSQIYVQYYYDYWYWYWGWYPYWGSYPGDDWYYPGVPVTVTYDVGTILVTMTKPANSGSTTIPVLWNAAINGLIGSDAGTTRNRIETTIDQAFSQSPYLAVE